MTHLPQTRWHLVASMRHYQFGWIVKARNARQPYTSHWFADREEAVFVKTLVERGLSFGEALRELHYRIDHEGHEGHA